MWRFIGGLFSIVIGATLALAGDSAQAQYPPPAGSVVLTTASIAPPVNSNTTLSCSVRDPAGTPIAGAPCVFTIVSEPGTDAAVGSKVVTRMTGPDGVATTNLYTGTAAGTVVIQVDSGSISSVVLVQVGGASAVSPLEGGAIRPPSTGDAGLASTD